MKLLLSFIFLLTSCISTIEPIMANEEMPETKAQTQQEKKDAPIGFILSIEGMETFADKCFPIAFVSINDEELIPIDGRKLTIKDREYIIIGEDFCDLKGMLIFYNEDKSQGFAYRYPTDGVCRIKWPLVIIESILTSMGWGAEVEDWEGTDVDM